MGKNYNEKTHGSHFRPIDCGALSRMPSPNSFSALQSQIEVSPKQQSGEKILLHKLRMLKIAHSHSDTTSDNVTHSDKTVEIRQFFLLTYLHFQTNEYIFNGMKSTIVFLVDNSDNCLVMKNQCSL